MLIDPKDTRPIFIQIKEGLESAILAGIYPEESQVPSTTELSNAYQINPATALKGINGLVDEGILYKKRGMGVFVKSGALDLLKAKRRSNFRKDFLIPMLKEAKRLSLEKAEVIKIIEETSETEV